MPNEAIGEVIVGVAELGLEAASGATDKKSCLGCLFMTFIFILLIGGLFYVSTKETTPTKGLVTKKLPNNKTVIITQEGENVYTINPDLYLNKQVGDSIILK
jgi:hypothetical protein